MQKEVIALTEREALLLCPEGGGDVKLTAKQMAWIDYYKQGKTATEAARLAGYRAKNDNTFQSIGTENLRKLAKYVKERDAALEKPRIADMEEINAFWTEVIRNKEGDMKDRLKASELRAKAMGGFLDRVEHSGGMTVASIPEEDAVKALEALGYVRK